LSNEQIAQAMICSLSKTGVETIFSPLGAYHSSIEQNSQAI